MYFLLGLIFSVLHCLNLSANESLSTIYLGSRESDPESFIENVSTIHGDYSEYEIDLAVPGPDPLILSRYYSSKDTSLATNLGGWRFYAHCYLKLQKDPEGKSYTTREGKFDRTYAYVGSSEGAILTYAGWQNTSNLSAKSAFKMDIEKDLCGVSNTARGAINAWTNLKNNELWFENEKFEFLLSNGGKRSYLKHPLLHLYILEQETLPSGNKIFYEYDHQARPVLVKMTNNFEKKVLSWIKIEYDNAIHIVSSDGQTVDYHLEQNFLTKANRSHQPSIHYHYAAFNGKLLLARKDLPERRFIEIDYYTDKTNKVKTITTPAGMDGTSRTEFIYENGSTEIYGPLGRKTIHRFNKNLQLVSIEHYLGCSLYRVQKRSWGDGKDATNLTRTTIEDASGHVYYIKAFSYDDKGNVIEEREYGNLTGANPYPISLDEDGNPTASQESHVKTYSYSSTDKVDVITQIDAKGNGIKFIYKKGTNLLIKKFIFENELRQKRWFYDYNEDGALTQIIVDDGDEAGVNSSSSVRERHITQITPKKDLPRIGAPEVIEEKYLVRNGKKELLLKKTVNHFDTEGNICAQDIYDANGEHRYTLKSSYESGLLIMKSDPIGNETLYSYDENHNLISTFHSNTGVSFEYGYDLKNRFIYTAQKDREGNVFETRTSYDASGNKLSEIDKFGNETLYYPDELGRIQSVSYPETSSIRPICTYQYDLFDHIISVTDPKGETTTKTYTVRGQPTKIEYSDGTEERFKYDAEGSLHRHLSKDGTVKVFEYDYMGRLGHIEHYARSSKDSGEWLSSVHYYYDVFHKTSEKDEEGNVTTYTYDGVGRVTSLCKDTKKTEFFYDALGRTSAIKKWKTSSTFTLELKEYDLLNNMIEERIEDHKGNLLLKHKYIYNESGLLKEAVGYPQNQESIITSYEYDGFGRLAVIRDAFNHTTKIIYDDKYINDLGQRALKRTVIDPAGNQKVEIFDSASHLTKLTQKNKHGQIVSETEFVYDNIGNQLIEKNAVIFAGEFLRTYTTEYTHGPNSRLATITHARISPDEKTTAFTYNSYGDLSAKLGPDGKTPIIYQYGKDGKLNSLSYHDKTSNKEISHNLSYDKKGNINKIKLGSTLTVLRQFDPNDQLTSEVIQDEFGSYKVGYKLDGESLIQSIQLPDDSFIQYDYTGPLVTNISRLTKDKKELYNHRIISRDLMGNILEEDLIGHAGARTQGWDTSGRRTEIFTDFFKDKIPEGGYDSLQNIRQREVTLDDQKYTIEYDYDDLFQLISEKDENKRRYSFDSLKNRLTKDNHSYKINNLNQLFETDGVTYAFDLNGNLSSKTINNKTWTFQYNLLNQLVSIQTPNQTTITFAYDLSGRRLSKKIESNGKKAKVFRYFYVGQTEIGALDDKGTIVELRIPSNPNHPERAPFIAFELKKETYVPIYDLQGNVVCLIDPENRTIVESYRYSAFGEKLDVLDSDRQSPWGYLGKRIDIESGLIYFGYRYYDPETGRWISPDPAGNIDGPNLYAFCRNNPLTYTDYFGLASESNAVDEKYFYGEYEPHCYCERHRDCKRGGDIGQANLSFPAIIYNDHFEKYYKNYHSPDLFIKDLYDNSTYYDLSEYGLPDLPYDLGICFINGVWNDLKGCKNASLYISRLSGGYNIHTVYNATHGTDIDILECGLGLNYIATGPVRQLHKMWNNFFEKSSATAKFLMICHSQGAIHVRNALLDYPPELRSRILVVAIAPGAYIYQETCLDVFHYRAQAHRDFIPRIDRSGSKREQGTIFTLDSHSNAPALDHELMSPTYQERLQEHIRDYILSQGAHL